MRVLDLSYHPLDVRSGGWVDLSRKGNHGTPYGGARPYMIAPGVMGFKFDGSSGLVSMPSSDSFNYLSEITIGLWVKNTGVTTPGQNLIHGYLTVWILHYRGSGFYLKAEDGTVSDYLGWDDTLPSGVWLYLVATWNGETMKLYVNGEKQATERAFDGGTTGRLASLDALYIGRRFNDGQPWFNGLIAQPIIEDRAWSEAEVKENMYRSPIYRMLRGLPHSWIYTKVPWKQTQGGIYVP